jgi:CRISPR-associated protein Cmr2
MLTDFKEQFIRAIEFCLRVDKHDGDLRALADWALSPSDEISAPGNPRLKVALVSGGATKIKSYVFESSRLPEIRGASSLLDRINLEDIPRLFAEPEPSGLGCEDCLIYANGGEVLGFAPKTKAAWLADKIEQLYAHETLVAQSVAVWQAFELNQIRNGLLADEDLSGSGIEKLLGYNPGDNRTFGSLIAPLALAKFRRREANTDPDRQFRQVAHFETVAFARRCSSCERRAATVNARVAEGEDRLLCEPCARKRIFGQLTKREDADRSWWETARFQWQPDSNGRGAESWATRLETWLVDQPELKEKYAVDDKGNRIPTIVTLKSVNDLGEIAQAADPQGFIGLIYADGNNIGQILENLTTPSRYAAFADSVFEATREAVFEALAVNLRPALVQREREGKALVHPFEILSIGGDDLLLIVPAQLALPIACDIARTVESRLLQADPMFEARDGKQDAAKYNWPDVQRCQGEASLKQCEVSLSAGVVLADAHTPVFYLEELANQLLTTAKRRAKWLKRERNYYGGTIDFLTLKSVTTISGTIDQFRDRALRKEDRRLYARPYTIAEADKLLDTIRLLKEASFPTNQLYRLRESLDSSRAQSVVDYRYFLSRDAEVRKVRQAIEEMWTPIPDRHLPHPWRAQLAAEEWETIWFDLVELLDFVTAEEKRNAAGQN